MRIGLIAPPWIPVPPPAYGGTEAVLDCLARGLADLGHEVRLFTVGESTCPVRRASRYSAAVEPMGNVALELAHVLSAYDELTDVDVIHDHTLAGSLVVAPAARRAPVVVTHHGPFTDDMRHIFAEVSRRAAIVAISQAQARLAGQVPIDAVIHHGVDLSAYRLGPGGGGFLLFLGRMSADKGVHRAVRAAHRAGRALVVATKMRELAEHEYFEREVRPLLRATDEVIIEPGLAQRINLLQHAEALLNPICWPEPFGLVMAEALACGTPVLAFARGAAPEIVDDGRTGYLCTDEDEMVKAIELIPCLDRADCRADATARFSLARMASEHGRFYARLVGQAPRPAERQFHQRPAAGPASTAGPADPVVRPRRPGP